MVRLGSPSPDKYRISSQFELIKDRSTRLGDAFGSPKKTFAFGAGREDFSKTVVNTTNMPSDAQHPGPGEYVNADANTMIGVNARKTAIKERKFYMQVERYARKNDIPGPGTYEDTHALHKKGLYINSQLK